MKPCTWCGNEIENAEWQCRFCDRVQTGATPATRRRAKETILTINLEAGHPLVAEALNRMTRGLRDARSEGARVVRLIHGYGSSGPGGAIRTAVRKQLPVLRRSGSIKTFVAGEDYLTSHVGGQLRSRYRHLKRALFTDKGNQGITLVEL